MTAVHFFLLLHFTGAIAAAGFVVAAFLSVVQRRNSWYRPVAMALAWLTAYQLVTGALLSLAAVEKPALFSYCRNILGYLTIISLAMAVLAQRMRLGNIRFPLRLAVINVMLGVVAASVAAVMLYV